RIKGEAAEVGRLADTWPGLAEGVGHSRWKMERDTPEIRDKTAIGVARQRQERSVGLGPEATFERSVPVVHVGRALEPPVGEDVRAILTRQLLAQVLH